MQTQTEIQAKVVALPQTSTGDVLVDRVEEMLKAAGLDDKILTTKNKVSKAQNWSRSTVERKIRDGAIEAVKDGHMVRVTVSSLRAYLYRQLAAKAA